jgi:hypothetical protein
VTRLIEEKRYNSLMSITIKLFLFLFILICPWKQQVIANHAGNIYTTRSTGIHSSPETVPDLKDPLDQGDNKIFSEEQGFSKSNILPVKNQYRFNFLNLLRGMTGILIIILLAYIFSENRRSISWRVILTGLCLQIFLAIGVLYVPFIQGFF